MSTHGIPKTPSKVKVVIGIVALLAAVADCISSGSMASLYFVAGGGAGYFLATL